MEASAQIIIADEEVVKSFWHRAFDYRKYMEDNVPFSKVDVEAGCHGKFSELVQDARMSTLRSLLLVHYMERTHEVLEGKYEDVAQDVDKYKHKVSASEKRLEDVLHGNEKAGKKVADLTTEKDALTVERDALKEKAANLEEDLATAQSELKDRKTEVAETFDRRFERAKEKVTHFSPELDLSGLDSFKIVVNGELVDEE